MANASSKSEHLKTFVIVYLNIILAQHFREPERGTNDIQRCHSKEIKKNLDGPVKNPRKPKVKFIQILLKFLEKILLFFLMTFLVINSDFQNFHPVFFKFHFFSAKNLLFKPKTT